MAVRCSAKQIADFVVLLGITGTIPEYCENADDAQKLKSLDLITSTLNIFIEAFDLYFEDIYRKCEVNSPLSEEKFIEFLKPRCLLLTKDNRCFNFILVCAFVFEMIHSFSYYNKCFHLGKVASKCLAAILNNRFKRVFEADSDWEGLMSFCIKMHGLVYPPADKSETDGKQLVGDVIDKTDASFLNSAQELSEFPKEKYVTDDNNDYSDAKMTSKNSYTSFQSDITSEIKEEELEDLSSSEFPTSTRPAHQLDGEGSSKSENTEKALDENSRKNDEKDCVKDASFLNFTKENHNILGEKMSIRNVTEKHEENATRFLEDLAVKYDAERPKDLSTLGLPSRDATDNFQKRKPKKKSLKVKDSSPKKAENKNKIFVENDARNKNEEDSTTEMTDSSLPEFVKEFTDVASEQTVININQGDNQKLDEIFELKKNIILPFEDYLEFKKVVEKLEDLCNLKFQSKVEDSPPEQDEDKEEIHDGNDARKDNRHDYATDMAGCSLHEWTKNSPDIVSEKTTLNNNKDNENLDEEPGFQKNLTLSYEDYSVIKKGIEKLEEFCKLGHSSTGSLHTFQLKVEDSSHKEDNKEKIRNENVGKGNNEKDYLQDMTVSVASNLEEESTNITINNNDEGIENLVPTIVCTKPLIRSSKKELAIKKAQEMMQLCNLEPDSSIGASHTCMDGEDFSPNAEMEDNKMIVDESNAKDGNENVTFTLVPDLTLKPTKTSIEKKDIDKNLKGAENLGQMNSFRKKLSLPLSKNSSALKKAKKLAVSHNSESISSTDAGLSLQLKDENAESEDKKIVDDSNASDGNENITFSFVPDFAHKLAELSTERKALDKNVNGSEKLGQMNSCRKKLFLPLNKDSNAQKAAKNLVVSLNLESVTSIDARPTLQLKDENVELEDKKLIVDERSASEEHVTFSLVPNLASEPAEIEKKAIDENLKGAEKPRQIKSCRKKLSLPLKKDSSTQNTAKELLVSQNLQPVTLTDAQPTPQPKNENFFSKNIRNMSANEIRTCITDNSEHLLKVLELLKKCEEDIEPNLLSPDDYDIPINEADENVEMEAGCGTSESSSNKIIFKSYMKAILFYKDMKMANSIKRIFHEDNPSNDKSPTKASRDEFPHEMSNEVAYSLANLILEPDDPHCSSCVGGMESFFDACVNNFNTKYSNNNTVSDLFRPLHL